MKSNLVFGRDCHHVTSIRDTLEDSTVYKVDFTVIPLFHPRLRRNATISSQRDGPTTRSDRELESKDWVASIVGKVSDWIELDSLDDKTRKSSEFCLMQEINWANHLGLQAVMLPPCRSHICPNYARHIAEICSLSQYQHLWLRLSVTPMMMSRPSGDISDTDPWATWNHLRSMVGSNHKLGVALEFNGDLCEDDLEPLKRWVAEPVKAITIATDMFLTNKKGYPVLSKVHQQALAIFVHFKVHIVFTGRPRHFDSYLPYAQYIQHLNALVNANMTDGEKFVAGYKDTLQSPLQPLMDNLEAQTYECFERDSTKYSQYEKAIALALTHLEASRGDSAPPSAQAAAASERDGEEVEEEGLCSTSVMSETTAPVFPIAIAVVGAGRGPLVAAALSAASTVQVPVKVYAIEKNDNAVITLRNRASTERWGDTVTIVHSDMRTWEPPEQCDILVSELLGSWGDNELSPECLDGAQRCLKPDTGISIPCDYTSFMAPISSSKLWMGVRDVGLMQLNRREKCSLDVPYVVKLHNYYQISDAKPLFRFEHPQRIPFRDIDNSRYLSVEFIAGADSVVHGFSGTFDATLFGDVNLSTVPHSETEDMFSWFPMFIPLNPFVTVRKGDVVSVSVWRRVSSRKVWYEWCMTSPQSTPIQNVNGESYWVGTI